MLVVECWYAMLLISKFTNDVGVRTCLGRSPHMGAPPPLELYQTSQIVNHTTEQNLKSIAPTTMTVLYKPTEAISLLRPSLLLPRIQPSSIRRARAAFSTTRNVQATPSFPGSPSPLPPRKSITLTGDTGRVRWNELSPGEKVVRTTQQSFNLVVVAVGVIATVRFLYFSLISG